MMWDAALNSDGVLVGKYCRARGHMFALIRVGCDTYRLVWFLEGDTVTRHIHAQSYDEAQVLAEAIIVLEM